MTCMTQRIGYRTSFSALTPIPTPQEG